MEDEENWLIGRSVLVFLDIFLVLVEQLWVETNVAWLVDTVDVTETRGNGEVR